MSENGSYIFSSHELSALGTEHYGPGKGIFCVIALQILFIATYCKLKIYT